MDTSPATHADVRIPDIVHFVFGLREQVEPFHPLHYAAVRSAIDVLAPERVVMHVHHLPYGIYWDLLRPQVELRRIEPLAEVEAIEVEDAVRLYRYAHHADVVRLDALLAEGGIYSDIDVLWVRPLPASLRSTSCVLGGEPHAELDAAGRPILSLTNAVIAAEPGAPFLRRWRDRIVAEMDGTWSNHSCRLAKRLADAHPTEVTVLPEDAFSYPGHSRATLARVLEGDHDLASLPPDVLALHVCAHLWWEEERVEFSDVCAADLDEQALRRGTTVLARAAALHLPDRWW